jgi:hypothetical protein
LKVRAADVALLPSVPQYRQPLDEDRQSRDAPDHRQILDVRQNLGVRLDHH